MAPQRAVVDQQLVELLQEIAALLRPISREAEAAHNARIRRIQKRLQRETAERRRKFG